MPAEIEAKFLNVDRAQVRARLAAAGFVCLKPDFLMKRTVFSIPGGGRSAWARVRDEGDKVTLSYKNVRDANSVSGVDEISLVVSDFESACHLLTACGLTEKSYQETRREIWQKGDVEVSIDAWPGLPAFVEIEAPAAAQVQDAAAALGFEWAAAVFGAVDAVYERYGIPGAVINDYPKITFSNVEEILSLRR